MIDYKQLCRIVDSSETTSFDDAATRLANGEDPHDIFDYVDEFSNYFACVQLNDKWNFIDEDGNLLSSEQWFDDEGTFHNGTADVKFNGKWHTIDSNGDITD